MNNKKPPDRRTTLYSTAQLDVVMDAMATQLLCFLPADIPIAVVGILRRGAPLADLLCAKLKQRHGMKSLVRLDLSIKRYADDLTLIIQRPGSLKQKAIINLSWAGMQW
jgi:pyrimidine operon attenuation protein / uracil phosphoribosyltransferase